MSKFKLKGNSKMTEYAVAYPPVAGWDLSRIMPCEDKDAATACHDSFTERGIESVVVTREISEWTPL